MDNPPLGEQQLEVLRYITERAPATARDVVEHFTAARGLARTTVLSVIERLLEKGYLTRRRRGGVFHYSPRVSKEELLQRLVREFVDKTLDGSVSPLVAYLVQTRRLSKEELTELQQLADAIATEEEQQP